MRWHLLFALTLAWLIAEHAWAIWRAPSAAAHALGVALLLAVAVGYRAWPLAVMALYFLFGHVVVPFLPREVWFLPGAGMTVLFGCTVLAAVPFPQTRRALGWCRLGSLDRVAWFWCCATSVLAAVALLLWAHWTDNLGFGVEMMRPMGSLSPWLVLGCIIPGFALLNAFAEEAVYRGLVQQALRETLPGHPAVVWVAQATVFAALHVASGFPNGAMGYAMVLAWGTMLGYLRHRTGGMLAPYLVHVAADLVIFYTLYALV